MLRYAYNSTKTALSLRYSINITQGKEEKNMENPTPEYICLFNAISNTIDELEILKDTLKRYQQQAEELYIERSEP